MSADNGIYIGHFPNSAGGFDFYVIEAAAIDNTKEAGELGDAYIKVYFDDSCAFKTREKAEWYANILERNVGYTEYGIVFLSYGRKFPSMTLDEAKSLIGR